jgi:6-bladed beta-propeller
MKSQRALVAVFRIGVVALITSCGGGESGGNWGGTIETLPNGGVRVTNPAEGMWDGGDAWRLERELVLGSVDGTGPDVFASISGLAVSDSGMLYVLDRQDNDLRIFDASGAHVRTVGRDGRGPGEYAAANGLAWLDRDSLLVVDQRGARYTVLDADGNLARMVTRRLSFYGWVFQGGIDGDHVFEYSIVGSEEDARPVLLGTRVRGDQVEADVAVDGAGVAERGPRVVRADTVFLASADGPLFESFSIRSERGSMVMAVPFTGGPKYYLDGKGGIWYGHGGTPRLYHATLEGDTLAEITLAIQPAPVTEQEVNDWTAQPFVEQFKQRGGRLDLSRIPDTKPYYDDIALDPGGDIWLTLPTAPGQTALAVLDPDGRYLGRLQIDGVARETFIPIVVRDDRLYLVGRDDLDVQRVYVYRIDRSGVATR